MVSNNSTGCFSTVYVDTTNEYLVQGFYKDKMNHQVSKINIYKTAFMYSHDLADAIAIWLTNELKKFGIPISWCFLSTLEQSNLSSIQK